MRVRDCPSGPCGLWWSSNPHTIYTPGFGQRANGTDGFYQPDWLGSTRSVTDSTGSTVAAQSYEAWGSRDQVAPGSPNWPTDLQFAGAWGYQTEYSNLPSEPGLGLDYLQQRYYDPGVGRFMEPDPLGYAAGTNLFEYADDDPVNGVDPTGEASGPWDLAWVGVDLVFSTYDQVSGASPASKALDNTALAVDLGALLIPGMPSGPGRVLVATGHASEAAATLQRTEHLLSAMFHFFAHTSGGRSCRNPGGRRGSPAHRDKVAEEEAAWTAKGWELKAGGSLGERAVRLPNGRWRFPDLWLEKDGLKIAIQVGRSTQGGLPVAREVGAMTDLIDATIFDDVVFVPYR